MTRREDISYKRSPSARPWLMVILLLAGAALRIAVLTDNRFHPDEALFATLARLVVSGRDPLLSTTGLLVDKPPLFYYIVAGSIALVGGSELAARLPGLFASLMSLALIARLAWQLWRSEAAAWLAMAVSTLSPFAILFAPTVFADPQYVMWLLAALVAVGAGRWGWGGLLFGLAVASKQSAWFFAPIVLMLGAVQNIEGSAGWRPAQKWALRFLFAFGLIAASIFIWDSIRHATSSFWTAGVMANNPGRLARSREVWPRAIEWLGWLHYVTALGWLNGVLAILIIALAPLEIALKARTRGAACSLAVLAFGVSYLGLQWLVAFPILDRYLLPLLFIVALLAGRAASLLRDVLFQRQTTQITGFAIRRLLPAILVVSFAGPALKASASGYPVGGDHGAFDGIDQAAAYLREQPLGSVVYYHALGWMVDYYLFDAYLYPIWFEAPAWLTQDLRVFGHTDTARFLLLSKTESQLEILNAGRQAACQATPVLEILDRFGNRSMTIYRLTCSSQ